MSEEELVITACGRTDVGRKRSNNQDSFLINEKVGLYVVADGMGGHSGGEVASSLAVKSLEKYITQDLGGNEKTQDKLVQGVKFSSQAVFEHAKRNPKLKGMGTTMTAVIVEKGWLHLAQVGDSRCYLFKDDRLFQISEDHSQVYELLKAGIISEEEMGIVQKNVITRSVGFDSEVNVDLFSRPLQKGDRYLICSDGLSGMVSSEEMIRILHNFSIEEGANKLIEVANFHGGEDNISVILIEVK